MMTWIYNNLVSFEQSKRRGGGGGVQV